METEKKSNNDNNTNNNNKLKHLGFVRMAAIQTLICVSNLYDYAKQNSGLLKNTVVKVERAVSVVVDPLHQKFNHVPFDLLLFFDNKVDEGVQKFNNHAPSVAKQVAGQAQYLMQVAVQKAQELVNQARVGGPRSAIHLAAKGSKHLALTQSVKVWIKLNQVPVIHAVASMAVPSAAHWSHKYNNVVKVMTQKGYPVFGYLPLIPIEEISEALKRSKAGEKENSTAHKSESSSDSD